MRANEKAHRRQISARIAAIMAVFLVGPMTSPLCCQASVGQDQSMRQERSEHIKKEPDFAPKLIHQPQAVVVQPNKPHAIECAVEAKPEAQVKWFKDDQLLASEPTHLEQTGSELMFFQTNDDDSGDYHCQASNYLGTITSDRFKLTVQSSVHDSNIRLEPRLAEVAAEQQAEFTCSIPIRESATRQQRHKKATEVSWKRNGRRLSVKLLNQPDELAETKAQFVARQVADNQFVLTITRTQLKDDNSTFTCLYSLEDSTDDADNLSSGAQLGSSDSDELSLQLPHESTPSRLRVYEQADFSSRVKLDVNLAPPIDNLASARNPHELPKRNHTTQLSEPKRVVSLKETLEDLYDMAKPTLIVLAVLLFVLIVVLIQLIYIRRRNKQNRYMKHQYAGGSSGTGSAVDDCDPVLNSLMSRTLSAPNASSLNGPTKKYRSYRDHMRKVATTNDIISNDLVDGYFLHPHQQQLCPPEQEPYFAPAMPNLYNQSLAAREQARSLLQASEHMRSLSNLNHAHQKQHSLQQASRLVQNGSHLNLPLSFAFDSASNQTQSNRLIDGATQLMASALWPPHVVQFANRTQPNLNSNRQDEHYQLVNCSSVSPSSSSSMAVSNSSSNQLKHSEVHNSAAKLPKNSTSSLNHYSTIETNDDEDRYEELDHPHDQVKANIQPRDLFRVSRVSSMLNADQQSLDQTQTQKKKSSMKSSISSSSGCGDSNTNSSLVSARFGSKRNTRQPNDNRFSDQLSPYAVSSVCESIPQPPPNSEAMRALNEQFDINQLMLLDESSIKPDNPLNFDPPPPPDSSPTSSSGPRSQSKGKPKHHQ